MDPRSGYTNGETRTKSNPQSGYNNNDPRNINQCNCEFVNEEMEILNRKGGRFLNKLYINNEEFREKIISFVKDKKELDLDVILDKRCKTNTLNTLGNKYLTECITSEDNTKDLIKIMANCYTTT